MLRASGLAGWTSRWSHSQNSPGTSLISAARCCRPWPIPLTLIAAYGLFVVFVAQLVRRLVFFTGGVTAESGWPIRLLMAVVDSMPNWVWVPPVLLLLVVVAWIAGGRAAAVSTTGWNRILCLLPGLSGVLQYFRHSMFAQLTATLLEHQVPFAEAMQLAGASVGNDLFRASVALAEADARGDRGAASAQSLRGMRPLMAWMLRREQAADQLISGLRHAASTYRERAADRVRWIRFVLPIFLVVVVAGGVTMLYGVSLFLPVSHTLQQLGEMSR